ncbi:MAG: hypothetical protein OXE75_02335 [bacterium]|nr:hypothetical protein [bacterium]
MTRRRWFWGLVGAMVYVAGMNDEALDRIGDGWLALPRWAHVVIVVVLLALAVRLAARILAARRAAYDAAVRAALGGNSPAEGS